jgi:hypothetical protein
VLSCKRLIVSFDGLFAVVSGVPLASTAAREVCSDGSALLTCTPTSPAGTSSSGNTMIIAIVVAAGGALLLIAVAYYCYTRRSKTRDALSTDAEMTHTGGPRMSVAMDTRPQDNNQQNVAVVALAPSLDVRPALCCAVLSLDANACVLCCLQLLHAQNQAQANPSPPVSSISSTPSDAPVTGSFSNIAPPEPLPPASMGHDAAPPLSSTFGVAAALPSVSSTLGGAPLPPPSDAPAEPVAPAPISSTLTQGAQPVNASLFASASVSSSIPRSCQPLPCSALPRIL